MPVALPVLERLKEGVFVASEGAVDFGSARGLQVESYTWHLSSVEIEAGFQHLNLLRFFSHFQWVTCKGCCKICLFSINGQALREAPP